jgi:hypothetical protein
MMLIDLSPCERCEIIVEMQKEIQNLPHRDLF